jgi:alpha-tubulin suppressor-like RCC1 family protein
MDYTSPIEALKVKRWPKDTIAAGRRHTVGLKSDGTVTAVGDNKYGQCNVSGWLDIVGVAAGNVHMATNTGKAHTIGLKSDGTVAAVGWNKLDQ